MAVTGRLFIRIDLEASGAVLGPGMADLLEQIERHGSLRKAAKSMGLSYRKAWQLLDHVRKTFGDSVVTSTGGASLTPLGQKLLQTFRNVQKIAERATAVEIRSLSKMVRKGGKPRLLRKGLRGRAPSKLKVKNAATKLA